MSQQPQTVIDLTGDPDTPPQPHSRHLHHPSSSRATRPPRFSRGDIIDLEEPSDQSMSRSSGNSSGSPELELLYSRSVPAEAQTRRQTNGVAGYVRLSEPHVEPAGAGQSWSGNGLGPLARLQEYARRFHGSIRPAVAAVIQGEERIRRDLAGMAQPVPVLNRRPVVPAEDDGLLVFGGPGGIQLPQGMDYEAAGFVMATPPPTYKAPSAAQPGFTRSPREEDVLVCPNCEEELGTGEDELKRQVWVVRACGHVCGTNVFTTPVAADMIYQGLLWGMHQK